MARLNSILLKSKIITKKESQFIPNSFDVVGDIAIFNDFPKELRKKEKKIAEKIIETHKNIYVVAKKSKKYSGRLRTPKISIMGGDRRKETMHIESGCRLNLNVETCYFSARSGSERLRIAKKVRKNESVLVLFSGVAPFPCVIAKNANPKEVYAIELSKTAHRYAEENIRLNKLSNVKLYQGDVKKVLPKISKKFDRIVMPLPTNAEEFLSIARKKLKQGGTIHLYLFANEKEFKEIKKEYKKQFKHVKLTKAGHYAPGTFRICLDLKN